MSKSMEERIRMPFSGEYKKLPLNIKEATWLKTG
jgi:hypothetical protein